MLALNFLLQKLSLFTSAIEFMLMENIDKMAKLPERNAGLLQNIQILARNSSISLEY